MTSSPPWAAMRASWGADVLHRNQMDGTFHDQTAATGLDSVPIVSATGEAGMTSLGEHWIKLTHSGLVEDGSMTAVLENHDAPSRCQRGG